jgi:hypothetical protein
LDEISRVGVNVGTVGVASEKKKVGVSVGVSVGVFVDVAVTVEVGMAAKVWVAAAPAVWAMMTFREAGSKTGEAAGGGAAVVIGAQASASASAKNRAVIREFRLSMFPPKPYLT